MTPALRAVACVAALLLVAGPAVAQKNKADTVRLRFAWPVGLAAQVTGQRSRFRDSDGTRDSSMIQVTYQLTVQPHARGRLVRLHGFEVPGTPDLRDLQDRLQALMPSLVVDTAGGFVAIEGVEAMQRELDQIFSTARAKSDSIRPEARAFLDRMRSAEVLTALAEQEWNVLVGTWIDADFVVGETYELKAEQASPLLPGVPIPMLHEFTAVARVPCEEGATEKRCIELEAFSHPDAAAMREVLRRVLAQLAPDMPKIDAMNVETEIRLVAEPGTLIPHHLAVTKNVSVRMTVNGQTTDAQQRESRSQRYRYGLRRS